MTASINKWSESERYDVGSVSEPTRGEDWADEFIGKCDFCGEEDIEIARVEDMFFLLSTRKEHQNFICLDCADEMSKEIEDEDDEDYDGEDW